MPSLEEQIHNLADTAFDATEPIPVALHPEPAPPSAIAELDPTPLPTVQQHSVHRRINIQHRRRPVAAAAVVLVVGLLAATTVWSGSDDAMTVTAEGPTGQTVITDPLNIDLTEQALSSQQLRIGSLGAVKIVDLDVLAEEFEITKHFLGTLGSEFGAPNYWQQVILDPPGPSEFAINVRVTDHPLPAIDESYQTATQVRGKPAIQELDVLTWLEDATTEISIYSSGIGDVTEASMSLAESLTFVQASDAWTDADGDHLGRRIDGDPILGGVVTGVEWDIVVSNDELALRTGDLNRVAFSHSFGSSDGLDVWYTIQALSNPGGSVIIGDAPSGFDQIDLSLEGGEHILIPTVQLDNGRTAFTIPVDDRLDPIEARFLSNGVAWGKTIDLSDIPPYLVGSILTGS